MIILHEDGAISYLKGSRLHRKGKPAYTSPKGVMLYYENGKVHCETGPAIITPKGYKSYFLFGIEISQAYHRFITNQNILGGSVK